MFPIIAIVLGLMYLAGKSNTTYIVPRALMNGETKVTYLSPEESQEEKRIKSVINSRNPKAMVRLAISLEKRYPKTAKILVNKAIIEEEKIEREKKIAIPSPIAGVSPVAWGKYVRIMGNEPGEGRIGIFGMSMHRLSDLGIIGKIDNDFVEWKEGITPEDFEGNPEFQYRVFAKSSKDHAKAIKQSGSVGQEICGEPATLSGLMAVAHFAGLPAYYKWVKNEKDREKFPATTSAYQKTNGLF